MAEQKKDDAKATETKATEEKVEPTRDSMHNPEGIDLTKGDKNADVAFSEE